MSFPSKEERAKCWEARDLFWSCLDQNTAPAGNSGEEVPKACVQLRKLFEKNCPNQWVKHFDRKRKYELFKAKMNQGLDPLQEQN